MSAGWDDQDRFKQEAIQKQQEEESEQQRREFEIYYQEKAVEFKKLKDEKHAQEKLEIEKLGTSKPKI